VDFDGSTFWLVPPGFVTADEFSKAFFNSLPSTRPDCSGSAYPSTAAAWVSFAQCARSAEAANRVASEALAVSKAKIASNCLHGLHIGDPVTEVAKCGISPDHTNSDLRTDQMVFWDGTAVYIDKSTHTVENVQWTHPN
jgi:hypothetical protein